MDTVITLIAVIREEENAYDKETEQARTAFANVKRPTRSEFYQSYRAGFKSDAVFTVNRCEYCGEEYLIHDGTRYKIIRAYDLDADFVELTCSEVT